MLTPRLTRTEHNAIVSALEWLRLNCDLDYQLDGETTVQRAALTRAMRKMGGEPHPKRPERTYSAAHLAGALAGQRAALETRSPERRPVGFQQPTN